MKNEIFLTRYNLQVAGCVAVILLIVSSFAFAGLCLESQAEIASRIQERVDRILASLVAYENSHGFPQLVSFVQSLRTLDLRKSPSISETVDWARALILLNADALEGEVVRDTLNVLLKFEQDIEAVEPQIVELIRKPLA